MSKKEIAESPMLTVKLNKKIYFFGWFGEQINHHKSFSSMPHLASNLRHQHLKVSVVLANKTKPNPAEILTQMMICKTHACETQTGAGVLKNSLHFFVFI